MKGEIKKICLEVEQENKKTKIVWMSFEGFIIHFKKAFKESGEWNQEKHRILHRKFNTKDMYEANDVHYPNWDHLHTVGRKGTMH